MLKLLIGTLILPLALTAVACTEDTTEAPAPFTGTTPDPPDDPPPRNITDPTAQLRRLTQLEFTHSLRHVLGPVTIDGLEPDLSRAGLGRVGAREVVTSTGGVERFDLIIETALEEVFGDPNHMAAFVDCGGARGQGCTESFIARVGQRAWRRPLTRGESDRYLALHGACLGTTGDEDHSLRCVASALLHSPFFLYRVELPTDGFYKGYDMASRLSYLLWSAPPDQPLLDAALEGRLDTPEGIRAEARRLLDDPRASQGLGVFVDEWFRLDQLDRLERDILSQTNEELQFQLGRDGILQPWLAWMAFAAREELRRMVIDQVLVTDGDYLDLLTTDTTFVDPHLQAFYRLPVGEDEPPSLGEGEQDESLLEVIGPPDALGFAKARHAAHSPRRGIMGTMAMLAQLGKQQETSPTRRGLYIMERILCMEIDDPPDDIDLCERPDGVSRRASIEDHHLCATACAGCHNQMDPIGFAMDSFDTIGRARTFDDWGFELDTRVTWTYNTRDNQAKVAEFHDLKSMAETFRAMPEATDCVTRQVYRFATGHKEPDEATINTLNAAFVAGDRRLKGFLVHLVGTDDFRKALSEPIEENVPPTLDNLASGLFVDRCAPCHVGQSFGGLSLSADDGLRQRLTGPSLAVPSMPLLTPGDPDNSYLWHKVHGTHTDVGGSGDLMPPTKALSEEELDRLRQWIIGGLP